MPDINITAFNSGVLSPLVHGRVDYDKYIRACEEINNFDVLKSGGVKRRSSTYNISNAAEYLRIEPFMFNEQEVFLLLFKEGFVRVLSSDGNLVSGVATEYKAIDIPKLQMFQSADVVFITHKAYPVSVIKRTDGGWVFEPLEYDFPPFNKVIVQDFALVAADAVDDWDELVLDYEVGTIVKNDISETETPDKHYYKALVDTQTKEPGVDEGWADEWAYIGSADYIYPDMPITISTDGEVETLSPSYKDAVYLLESKREDNIIEVSTLSTVSEQIFVRGDWTIRTSGTWTGTLLLQKAAEETPDEWVVVHSYTSAGDTNYNQTGVENDGAFYRLNCTSGSVGNVLFTNQNYYSKGIVRATNVSEDETIDRGTFFDEHCTNHYSMDDDAANNVIVDEIDGSNATLSTGTTADIAIDGVVDGALDLDGKWVILPPISPFSTNPTLSFSAWIKASKACELLYWGGGIKINVDGDGFVVFDKIVRSGWWGATPLTLKSSNKIVFGKWTHIAITTTPTTMSLYIDGVISTSRTDTAKNVFYRNNTRHCAQDCIADEVMFFDEKAEDEDIYRLFFLPVTKYDGVCLRRMKNGSVVRRWARSLFNNISGYPSSAYIYEGRLWFTGTAENPNVFVCSKISDYYNFEEGANDDDAIRVSLDSGKLDQTHWIFGINQLIIGSAGGEWLVRSKSNQNGITPSTISVRQQTSHGSLPIRPIHAGNRIVFSQIDGKTLRDFFYEYQIDGYVASDITVLIDNLFTAKIKELAFQQYPNDTIYALLEDGKLVCITYDIENKIIAGYRYTVIDGVESVCVLNNNGYDELYMLANNGSQRAVLRVVEQDKYQEQICLEAIKEYEIDNYDYSSDSQIDVDVLKLSDGGLYFEIDVSEDPLPDKTTLKQPIFMYEQGIGDTMIVHLIDRMFLRANNTISLTGTKQILDVEIESFATSTVDPDGERPTGIDRTYAFTLKDVKWSDHFDSETFYQYGSVDSRLEVETFPIVASSDGKRYYFAENIAQPEEDIQGTQTITLEEGDGKYISFNVLPNDKSINSVLNDAPANVDFISESLPNPQFPSIKSARYVGSTSVWYNNGNFDLLEEIDQSSGYHYQSALGCNLTITGNRVPLSTPITVPAGQPASGEARLIPYLPQEAMSVNDALVNVNATEGDYITHSNSNGDIYLKAEYDGSEWVGVNDEFCDPLTELEPGKGYYLQCAIAQTFTYPVVLSDHKFKLYRISSLCGDKPSDFNTPITMDDLSLTESDFVDGKYDGGKIIPYEELEIEDSFEQTLIDGLEFYANQRVRAYEFFANTSYYTGDFTVNADGYVRLTLSVSKKILFGLPYEATMRTVRLEMPMGGQTSQSNIKRITRIAPRIVNTSAISMRADDQTREVNVEFSNYSKDIYENILSGYDSKATVEFKSIGDKPLTILSAVVSLEYRR